MKTITISSNIIGDNQPTYIIAEIGINHNGVVNIAKKLIDMAKNCGCDAVKFQKRTVDIVYSKELLDSPRESPWGTTQRAQKEALEFGKEEYDIINDYCKQLKIEWFASSWDIESQMFLRQYNLKHNKVASPMLTNIPLLNVIAEERKHTFISTGMSTYDDIDKAIDIFRKHKCPFTLMHCQSTYPAAEEDLNLLCIKTLRERYNCDIGYSGHEVSILPPTLAVVLGAVAIERHITLDRAMYGSDQSASVEKRGVELLVRDTRRVAEILGDGIKKVSPEEKSLAAKLRYFREK
ncbi:N-acetylneuraminate synthase family protein [Candidatus Pacearchaeota archaeon]|nr:N-acetylneuraminate synthase family protein [Candidatus Pacearchaeota archaeon]